MSVMYELQPELWSTFFKEYWALELHQTRFDTNVLIYSEVSNLCMMSISSGWEVYNLNRICPKQ